MRTANGWLIEAGSLRAADCMIEMPQRDVWLLFTKKLTPGEAAGRAKVTGEERLALPFFRCKAVMG